MTPPVYLCLQGMVPERFHHQADARGRGHGAARLRAPRQPDAEGNARHSEISVNLELLHERLQTQTTAV